MILLIAASIALTSCADLPAALGKVKGGDTITLPPGPCGAVGISDRTFDVPVTIRSANPARPAVFSRLVITNSTGLTFSNIGVAVGDSNAAQMVRVSGGSNITLDRVYIHGLIDGAVKDDRNGISVSKSDGFTLSGSRLLEVAVGIAVTQSKRLVIRDNDISMIGIDAIEIPAVDGALIAWNKISKFRTTDPYHPDGIQCWTTGQPAGCKNIRIIANQFLGDPNPASAYRYPQGIFFGDEEKRGDFANIEITGNFFLCPNWHAISVAATPVKGLVVKYNRIQACPGVTPWIRVAGPDVVVEGNVAPIYYVNSTKASAPMGNMVGSASR